MLFTKREILSLCSSILILGFVFGFDDGQETLKFGYWVLNLFKSLIFVTIVFVLYLSAQKLQARHFGADCTYKIWSLQRFGFNVRHKIPFKIPIGIILSLFFVFISKGKLTFTAIGEKEINSNIKTGRKRIDITEFEESLIILAGPLMNVLLIMVANIISNVSNINLDLFVNINFYFALFNLLPLPGLDGMKLFFGSRSLYIFGVLFVILSMFLINYNLILGLIASFVISLIILTLYFKKWE